MIPTFKVIDSSACEFFAEQGWLLTRLLDEHATSDVRSWVGELMAWEASNQLLEYRELTEFGPKLCRVENFVPFHTQLGELLTAGVMRDSAGYLSHVQRVA